MARRLHKVESSFLQTVKNNNLIVQGDRIVVGVSGGPDSTTLLSCLVEYKKKVNFEIVVAHVNHLIREESTDDEKYVENMCEKLKVKCYIKRVEVEQLAREQKRSTEEMGRMVRYEFFNEIARKENANKIAIAHNMNDNAETILLNLIRGSGLDGLEGIQPLQYGKFIRPLINCERKDIEDYCEKNKLNPQIDKTNKENIYTRNKIRNILIPEIQKINPNIIQNLSQTSKIVAENNEVIDLDVTSTFNAIVHIENNQALIQLKDFNCLQTYIKKKLIILAIEKLSGNRRNIEKTNIDDIIKLAENGIGNKYIQINKIIRAEVKNKILYIHRLL